MELRVASTDVDLTGSTVVAGALEGLVPVPGSEQALAGVDQGLLEAAGFEGKRGQTVTVPHPEAGALMIIGLGEELSFESIRSASGKAVRKAKTPRVVTLLTRVNIDGATRAVTEGTALGGYQFHAYKTNDEGLNPETVDLVGGDDEELADAVVVSEATNLARDWVNTPAKDCSPEALASMITEKATEGGIEVEVWDKARIEVEGLDAVLGVAAGSDRDPRVVTLSYRPDGATTHLALVGKGITFDSGGLSLKAAKSMEEMKDDMSGAAVVAATTIAIAALGLPVNVTCITPLTDNAVGGNATRPGDVLQPVAGPTVEVLNTDAEGRLILADALGLAQAQEPDLLIDVATLTGAARVALGDRIAAVFASETDVAELVLAAASRAGEHFWELPLFKGYRKSLDSNVADVKNVATNRYGGAIIAAVFLAEYAGEGRWAHLDIAGPARARETRAEYVKGASGIGVRTLVELARGIVE